MRHLRFTKDARSDIAGIARYIAEESGSRATAEQFAGLLRQQCERLAQLSGTIGRPRSELIEGLRSFAFRGYVIFFRYQPDALEVVNVLEGHRDVVAYFQPDEI